MCVVNSWFLQSVCQCDFTVKEGKRVKRRENLFLLNEVSLTVVMRSKQWYNKWFSHKKSDDIPLHHKCLLLLIC